MAALASWEDFTSIPFQPTQFDFPKHKIEGIEFRTDSCQSAWFKRWKWLHYHVKTDSVFCHYCTTCVQTGKLRLDKRINLLVTFGFFDWDNALICFQKHERTNLHRAAVKLIEMEKNEMDDFDEESRPSEPSLDSRISSICSCPNRRVVIPTAATRIADLPGCAMPEGIDPLMVTEVTIVVVGDKGCGITTLLDATMELKRFYKKDCMEMIGNLNFFKAGSSELRKYHTILDRMTSVVMMCFSIDNRTSLKSIETKWLKEVRAFCSPAARIVLVGNKQDVRTDTNAGICKALSDKLVSQQEGIDVAYRIDAYAYVECSAKKKIGIIDVLENIAEANLENIRAVGNS